MSSQKEGLFNFFVAMSRFFNVKIRPTARPVLRSTEQVATGRMKFSRRVFSSTSLRLGIKIKSHFCDKAFYFGRAMINVYHFNNGTMGESLKLLTVRVYITLPILILVLIEH